MNSELQFRHVILLHLFPLTPTKIDFLIRAASNNKPTVTADGKQHAQTRQTNIRDRLYRLSLVNPKFNIANACPDIQPLNDSTKLYNNNNLLTSKAWHWHVEMFIQLLFVVFGAFVFVRLSHFVCTFINEFSNFLYDYAFLFF